MKKKKEKPEIECANMRSPQAAHVCAFDFLNQWLVLCCYLFIYIHIYIYIYISIYKVQVPIGPIRPKVQVPIGPIGAQGSHGVLFRDFPETSKNHGRKRAFHVKFLCESNEIGLEGQKSDFFDFLKYQKKHSFDLRDLSHWIRTEI